MPSPTEEDQAVSAVKADSTTGRGAIGVRSSSELNREQPCRARETATPSAILLYRFRIRSLTRCHCWQRQIVHLQLELGAALQTTGISRCLISIAGLFGLALLVEYVATHFRHLGFEGIVVDLAKLGQGLVSLALIVQHTGQTQSSDGTNALIAIARDLSQLFGSQIQLVRLDGSRSQLQGSQLGISLTLVISDDGLHLFEGGSITLGQLG